MSHPRTASVLDELQRLRRIDPQEALDEILEVVSVSSIVACIAEHYNFNEWQIQTLVDHLGIDEPTQTDLNEHNARSHDRERV